MCNLFSDIFENLVLLLSDITFIDAIFINKQHIMKSIFKLIIAAAMVCVFAACTEKPYGDEPQKKPEVTLNQNLDFTLAVLSVDEKTAQIKITHNGMTSDTWYGFHTSQVSESDEADSILYMGPVCSLH